MEKRAHRVQSVYSALYVKELSRRKYFKMAVWFASQREANFKQDGCLALRKSVLDRMREKSAPGPIYNPKPRVSSTEKSLRDITFGTGPARYECELNWTKTESIFLYPFCI